MEFSTRSVVWTLGLCIVSLFAHAQAVSAYSAKEIAGQVSDEETGQPISGAVIVARWNWLTYYATLEEHGWGYGGEVIHIAEAVTNGTGNYVIPAWGPKKMKGHLSDFDDPRLFIFKSGYIPLQLRNDWGIHTGWSNGYAELVGNARHNDNIVRTSQWNGKVIKLKKFMGTCAQFAELIRNFQEGRDDGGLRWRYQGEDWKTMPKMVEALANEKQRLGKDGDRIESATYQFGHSGNGSVIDTETGKPFSHYVVINVSWKIRAIDAQSGQGPSTKELIEQGTARPEAFTISAWAYPSPTVPPGWELDRLAAPVLYAYDSEAMYHHLTEVLWPDNGQVLRMRRLLDSAEARAQELRLWRNELDSTFNNSSVTDDQKRYANQLELIRIFQENCEIAASFSVRSLLSRHFRPSTTAAGI